MFVPRLRSIPRSQWRYLFRSILNVTRPQRQRCPNCGSRNFKLLKRKYLVTALVRCMNCQILYRIPTDPPGFNEAFYEKEYTSSFTTDCPDPQTLAKFLSTGFRNSPKDFARWIELLLSVGATPPRRLLDYGASWGYGTWQFAKAGFDAYGYEPCSWRAQYAADKLGVQIVDDLGQFQEYFDIVFSCHVLEHVPKPGHFLREMKRLLRPGGFLVCVTPNGSSERLTKDPVKYHREWGFVHPFFLDSEFYRREFQGEAYLLTTVPCDMSLLAEWDREKPLEGPLDGPELVLIWAQPTS
jgi:SAM-dependent methyltransferase